MNYSQAKTTEEEIIRTLTSISRTAAETDRISSATAEVVNAQGEQIDSIHKNAQIIHEKLNTTQWLIRGMKSWGGKLQNVFYGPSSDAIYPSEVSRGSAEVKKLDKPTSSVTSRNSEFDKQVDDHLDNISNVLGGIHARSLELHNEIARQVKTVEYVDKSLDRSKDRILKQQDQIKSLR